MLGSARLLMAETERFPDVCADLWNIEVQAVVAPIIEFIAAAQVEGALLPGEPRTAAMHLVNLACGGLRFRITPPATAGADRSAWIDSVVAFVWCEASG